MSEHDFEIMPDAESTRLCVRGKTIKELFRNSVRGMAAFVHPEVVQGKKKSEVQKIPIRAEAVDVNSLLVEFLSGVISHSDLEGVVFTDAAFQTLGDNFLEGEIAGVSVEAFENEVRSVSYSDIDIKKNTTTGMYEATLVLET